MYIYEKQNLPKELRNAVDLCEEKGLLWRNLYIDPKGEMYIMFSGKLSEEQVREVLKAFLKIVGIESFSVEEDSYVYSFYGDGEDIVTGVFTPDGISFKKALNL